MRPYVVRIGDCLSRIALTEHVDADEVWNLRENADLRARHPNPDMLVPGDVLYLPDQPPAALVIKAGKHNRYTAHVPTTQVKFTLRRGAPLANEPYAIDGLQGGFVEGTTDSNGLVTLEVPLGVREILVVLKRLRTTIRVCVGALAPPTVDAGVDQRLRQMGHGAWPVTGVSFPASAPSWGADDRTHAVASFQRAQQPGQPASGELDADTRAALESAHDG